MRGFGDQRFRFVCVPIKLNHIIQTEIEINETDTEFMKAWRSLMEEENIESVTHQHETKDHNSTSNQQNPLSANEASKKSNMSQTEHHPSTTKPINQANMGSKTTTKITPPRKDAEFNVKSKREAFTSTPGVWKDLPAVIIQMEKAEPKLGVKHKKSKVPHFKKAHHISRIQILPLHIRRLKKTELPKMNIRPKSESNREEISTKVKEWSYKTEENSKEAKKRSLNTEDESKIYIELKTQVKQTAHFAPMLDFIPDEEVDSKRFSSTERLMLMSGDHQKYIELTRKEAERVKKILVPKKIKFYSIG